MSAKTELILSAGSVNTPSILLHSGIGNSTALKALDIPVLLDNPSVGANLTDHIGCGISYLTNSSNTLDSVWRNQSLYDQWIDEWKHNKTGLFVDPSENQVAFLRLPENSTVWDSYPDPSSGPETAHYEFLFQVSCISQWFSCDLVADVCFIEWIVVPYTDRQLLELACWDGIPCIPFV